MTPKKNKTDEARYCVQYDDHARTMCSVLCSFIEHQSLVDLVIRCGSHTIHAHKCIVAANSPYFREQLEKIPGVEQIVIAGLEFAVLKSLVEFMYCGETYIVESNFKYVVAAAKKFQIRGIQALAADNHGQEDENIQIPPPLFLTKKPKYPSTYLPMGKFNPNASNVNENVGISKETSFQRRHKRKYMRTEAEKACAKEAAASRLTLENLQKELAGTDQMNSFVIEETCTETTVENFIPNSEETFLDNINQLEGVSLEVTNYADVNPSLSSNSGQIVNMGKPCDDLANLPCFQGKATEKLKHILGDKIPTNVELVFKTNDGRFVNLTEEVLQNITEESLQYQVIDEHGRAGEVQQFSINVKTPINFQAEENPEYPFAKSTEEQQFLLEKFDVPATEIKMADICGDQIVLEAMIETERRENEMRNAEQMQKALSDGDELELSSKNSQKSRLDSLKKPKAERRKVRAMSVSSERQFCDEFFNVELPEHTKNIYEDIGIMEPVVGPMMQAGDELLNKMPEFEERILDDGNRDCLLPSSKIEKIEDEGSLFKYSPRKTRSNRSISGMFPPENVSNDKPDLKPRKE